MSGRGNSPLLAGRGRPRETRRPGPSAGALKSRWASEPSRWKMRSIGGDGRSGWGPRTVGGEPVSGESMDWCHDGRRALSRAATIVDPDRQETHEHYDASMRAAQVRARSRCTTAAPKRVTSATNRVTLRARIFC